MWPPQSWAGPRRCHTHQHAFRVWHHATVHKCCLRRGRLTLVRQKWGGARLALGSLPRGQMQAIGVCQWLRTWAPAPRVLLDALARPVSLPSSLEGDGLVAEFGVGWGYSLATIAKHFGGGASARASGAVFGFDSFKGLPEAWRIHPQGDFSTYSTLPRVEGASLVAGWFNETIPAFFADPTNAPLLFFDGSDDATKARPARFVHIDCDLYSSTAIVLAYLGPHLRDGTLIVFDEIFGYPGFEEHELRALFEFVERTGRRLEPLALGKLAPFGDPIAASFRVW